MRIDGGVGSRFIVKTQLLVGVSEIKLRELAAISQ